ncbi:MAG: NTP transferase domain-containing protein [Candidatus Peribacteraceae bacterium]|nr:NTP transferase domain-containing protein [Candidatus Peribacteraceae bacterium]
MKTLLLLAGRSKRFWPLQDKNLFSVCGKTLLEHQVERLNSAGITDITLVGGSHNIKLASTLFPKLEIIEQEDLDLGMRGALLSALPSVGDNPVFIVSGNDVLDPNGYKDVIAVAKKSEGGAILAQKVESYFPGGYLTLEGNRIISIIEKPKEGSEPSNLVNLVAHVHNNASLLLETLKEIDESRDDGYEQALQKCFGKKEYVACPYEGKWQAVKYPWHMLGVLKLLLDEISEPQIHPSAEIHPSANIEGNVIISKGVKVFAGAMVKGPCFIGKDSIVANNALVRDASIGKNSVVGFSTEVKGSVLGTDVWTHITYIGDSVVGNNVSFGAGCATGNFRLDEKIITPVIQGNKVSSSRTKLGAIIGSNSRLGIQIGINPGCMIGSGSFVAGGTYIESDIPNNSFVCMKKGEITIKENRDSTPSANERNVYKESVIE